ncbi:hypothetical protein AZE42_01990 [Rhizopogon vesiculosus]|uniref:Uncharacterized protein n=1 Tax=Rhizopogon vesiculosus TaxID=180088 RepID=A0A1J8QHX8_9AGAM|nr:hypothetical protein AZE42_01990 [Rhizopogon vesiculosus]
MLAQVNVTHSYTSDQKTRRKRVRSSGSSSVSSYDLPKTPVDAYSHLREDRLGGDFTVLKRNRWESNPSKSPLLKHGPDIRVKTYGKGSQVQTPIKALPSWLASTFSALNPEHPLRELLPPSPVHEDEIDARTRNDPPRHQGTADNIFAFSPFDADAPGNNDTPRETSLHPSAANPALYDDEVLPCDPTTVNVEIQTFDFGEDIGFRPFATPGTIAVLQHTGISSAQQIVPHVNKHISSNDASLSGSNAALISSHVIRRTMQGPETSVPFLHRGSPITSDALGPDSLTSNFQDNELPINMFSTPGPTFTVSRPVYFDSPTEDPSLSDPLEPESYELDLDALDFRWQPFLRKSLPDHGLGNPANSSLNASVTLPAFEEPKCPSLHSPGSIAYEQTANTDACIEYDLHRGSPVSGHVIQQTSAFVPVSGIFISPLRNATLSPVLSGHVIRQTPSPQLNVQSGTSTFAPASGIFVSPFRDATPFPVISNLADVQNDQVKIQGPTVSSHEKNHHTAFQLVSSKFISTANSTTESHEQPFTPPRPTQTSQPQTPKKDRSSQTRSTQPPPRQEQRSTVSWMLSRRSLAARGTVGHEEIDGLPSQRSDTSHDTIESWTDNH